MAVTGRFKGGRIHIPKVTGNVIITAIGEPVKISNGLQLEFDFRNLEASSTNVIDTIHGVTLQNLSTSYFSKTENGIYGSNNYRYADLLTTDDAYSDFKAIMSASEGLTVETFGKQLPTIGNTGPALFIGTNSAYGYEAYTGNNPGFGASKMPYIDTNDTKQTATLSPSSYTSTVVIDGVQKTIPADIKDFMQADVIYYPDGTTTKYFNGYPSGTIFAAPENFSSWDIETALTPTNTYFIGSRQIGQSAEYYLTYLRIYNRALTTKEIAQNFNFNKHIVSGSGNG